jgi:hypothetical protein
MHRFRHCFAKYLDEAEFRSGIKIGQNLVEAVLENRVRYLCRATNGKSVQQAFNPTRCSISSAVKQRLLPATSQPSSRMIVKHMALRSRTVLSVYILLSIAFGIYEAVLFSVDYEVTEQLQVVWEVVALLLVIFWVELDSREHKEIYRPFEFGFLLLIFWIVYLPYYLYRTRRAFAGLWLVGLIGLSNLGYALSWLVYLAR